MRIHDADGVARVSPARSAVTATDPRCSISYLYKEINSFYVSPLLSGRTDTPSAARKSLKVHRLQSQFVSTCFARAEKKRC